MSTLSRHQELLQPVGLLVLGFLLFSPLAAWAQPGEGGAYTDLKSFEGKIDYKFEGMANWGT